MYRATIVIAHAFLFASLVTAPLSGSNSLRGAGQGWSHTLAVRPERVSSADTWSFSSALNLPDAAFRPRQDGPAFANDWLSPIDLPSAYGHRTLPDGLTRHRPTYPNVRVDFAASGSITQLFAESRAAELFGGQQWYTGSDLAFDSDPDRVVTDRTGGIAGDFQRFYSREGLALLSIGAGASAVLANSDLDYAFRKLTLSQVVNDRDAFDFGRYLGDAWIMVPAFATISATDWLFHQVIDAPRLKRLDVGGWSNQTLRAMLVGAPGLLALQPLIGTPRPPDANYDSHWSPFRADNGVSGHAFVGAVPFLVAAKRTDDMFAKTCLVCASTLTAYSRVYDDFHFLSQVVMGWWFAVLAVEATEMTRFEPYDYRVVPLAVPDAFGFAVEFRR